MEAFKDETATQLFKFFFKFDEARRDDGEIRSRRRRVRTDLRRFAMIRSQTNQDID